MNSKSREYSIDLIKIIAMYGVMTLHCNMAYTSNIVAQVLYSIATISIPLFFMTSGYCLMHKKNDFKYSYKKIVNILRFTFVICTIRWMFEWSHTPIELPNIQYLWLGYISSFIQGGLVPTFWFFGSLMIMYIILPIINKLKRSQILMLIILLIGVQTLLFSGTTIYGWEMCIPQTFRLWNWLLYFLLGGLLKTISVEIDTKFIIPFFLSIILIILEYIMKQQIVAAEYYYGNIICVMLVVSIFIYIKSKCNKCVFIISILSKLFLPCYFIHIYVISFLDRFINLYPLEFSRPIVFTLLTYIFTTFFSLIIMRIPLINKIFRI